MKKIAAITMVRNDDFYLRKWVQYYSRELGGKEHLYIYYDGVDQEIGDFCRGTNAFKVPKIGKKVVEAEKGRLQGRLRRIRGQHPHERHHGRRPGGHPGDRRRF